MSTTAEGRDYRRGQAARWAQENDVEFVTTSNRHGRTVTLHKFSCPVVQRLVGSTLASGVRKANKDSFFNLFLEDRDNRFRLCSTCKPEGPQKTAYREGTPS
jgi:hypothetical protein